MQDRMGKRDCDQIACVSLILGWRRTDEYGRFTYLGSSLSNDYSTAVEVNTPIFTVRAAYAASKHLKLECHVY